jgi:hypothetical protein
MENINDGSDSWYYTSTTGYNQYWVLPGWTNLNWKDKGFETVFDFITVYKCQRKSKCSL